MSNSREVQTEGLEGNNKNNNHNINNKIKTWTFKEHHTIVNLCYAALCLPKNKINWYILIWLHFKKIN